MRITLLISALLLSFAAAATDDDLAARQLVADQFDGLSAEEVTPSPVPGMYQVFVGPQVYYVSADGQYLFYGDLFQLSDNNNLTEAARSGARLEALETFGEDRMIIFQAPNQRHTITVFTDISCTYCRKLHREIQTYLHAGITVRYLAYPRSGPNTDDWREMEQVWCAADPQAALTAAKQDQPFDGTTCLDDTVAASYRLGRMIGFSGTPAIITDTGYLVPGYLPVAQLLPILDGS